MPIVTIGDNAGDTYGGSIDTQLFEPGPATNYGAETYFETSKYAASQHGHGAIAFTGLSNIPSGSTINSVVLHLWLTITEGAGPHTITARRLLRNWTEVGATWDTYDGSTGWTTVGALSNGNDRDSAVSATASIANTDGQYYDWSGAQFTADVQSFVASGSNFGWHLERTDGQNDTTTRIWESSEGVTGQRPYLTVDYTEGASGGGLASILKSRVLRPAIFSPGLAR